MPINQLIAQGAHTQGINPLGLMQGVQDIQNTRSRNSLLDSAIQNGPVRQQRATTEYEQGQEDRDYTLKIRAAGEYSALYEANDIDGALNVFKQTLGKVKPENMTPEQQQSLQRIVSALQSPDPSDNKMVADELYKNAKALSTMGQEGKQETFGQPFQAIDPDTGKPGLYRGGNRGGVTNTGLVPPPEAGGADAKEIAIQRFMAEYPKLTKAEATAAAYGQADVYTDTIGVTRYRNNLDPSLTRVLTEKPVDRTSVQTPQQQTAWAAAEEGTGLWNAAARKAANIFGQVGADIGFAKEEIKAKQTLDGMVRNLKQGYALSPKYPVAEQEMIVTEAGLMVSLWEDPKAMQERMIPLEGTLARNIAQAEIDARDSTDPEVKRDANRVARHMRSYMNGLGLPENKREDVRSWAQAQEGFFDMSIEDQERFIQKTAQHALFSGQQ